MTSVFSALPMPKGGGFLRRRDLFGKAKVADEGVGDAAAAVRYFDVEEADAEEEGDKDTDEENEDTDMEKKGTYKQNKGTYKQKQNKGTYKQKKDTDTDTDTDKDKEQRHVEHLNDALRVLVDLFPDIEPDVFREMLLNLSDDSRLQVVTEHVLRHGERGIQGRYRKGGKGGKGGKWGKERDTTGSKERDTTGSKDKDTAGGKDKDTTLQQTRTDGRVVLRTEETFRSQNYKDAVKLALYAEFKSLSHSTIKAVLAEHNHSYTLARPTLQQLAARSWRFTLASLWTRKRPGLAQVDTPPLIDWLPDSDASPLLLTPRLHRTTSPELNLELYRAFVAPVLAQRKADSIRQDAAFALQLNQDEAEQAGALFDCECCYAPAAFEHIATCDDACHYICFACIRHAVSEALYGQGWARNIDATKASLRCLAPAVDECHGCIPPDLLRRALISDHQSQHMWHKLEDRVASEALIKSRLPLSRCPFCSYAEIDDPPKIRFKNQLSAAHHLTRIHHSFSLSLAVAVFVLFYPIICPLLTIAFLLAHCLHRPLSHYINSTHTRIARKRRGLRFTCRNPRCARSSCTSCFAAWRDPHVCHQESLQSLRHAIEAATTQSIKRVCPKCSLSFVKSSGCNKLVCNCGYVMCYVCRQEIGMREGYAHFCQHFRERPGERCRECDRCDLYVVEDEDGVIRRAAELAEKEWVAKEKQEKGEVWMGEQRYGDVVKQVLKGKTQKNMWDFDGVFEAFIEAVTA